MKKRLKYGSPGELESIIYELGFSDRNLSIEIVSLLDTTVSFASRNEIIKAIKNTTTIKERIENEYPDYFLTRFNNLYTR
jgi:hypothetical protein